MFVCHCRGVTDRTVAACLAAGARDLDALAARCGAGAGCGGCEPVLRELLAEQAEARLDRPSRRHVAA